jgi:PAS domain S-box-containing protein
MTQAAWCSALLLGAGVIYLGLAAFVWSNRKVAGSHALIVMLVGVKVWSICYALELASTNVPDARVWAGLKYTGIVVLPAALWSFVWQYTGRGRLPRPALAALLVHPVVVLAILATRQHLLQDYRDPGKLTWVLGTSPSAAEGTLFVYHQFYVGIVMLAATGFLLWQLSRVAPPYRRQGRVLIVASIVPFVANVAWTSFASDRWHVIDPTPFLFLITAIVLVWGFFRLRLLNLLPVARGLVLEQMADGVIVLDLFGRVVDVNPAATRLLGREKFTMVGRRGTDFLPVLGPMLDARRPDTPPDETEVVVRRAGMVDDADARTVSVSVSDVRDAAGRRSARLVVLHDVTEHRRTETRLRDLLEEQTSLAETLQQGLRPAQLPEIDGVSLAARAVPATGRAGVSGDFYDVHPAGPSRSAFVLGDVSGKGVHAAIMTSMARYTARTLSAQGWRPRQVLEQLNEALLAADDPERFCTVVYGHVEQHLPPPDGPGGVRLTLALGGHPPPLLRRRDRTVQPVGTPGTALGLVPAVEIHEVHLDLAAGDVLLAYTDGVTEARRGNRQFGDERLAAVLAMVGAPPPRQGGAPQEEELRHGGGGVGVDVGVDLEVRTGADGGARAGRELAEEVADGVLDAVTNYASSRDDVAVLVLAVL